MGAGSDPPSFDGLQGTWELRPDVWQSRGARTGQRGCAVALSGSSGEASCTDFDQASGAEVRLEASATLGETFISGRGTRTFTGSGGRDPDRPKQEITVEGSAERIEGRKTEGLFRPFAGRWEGSATVTEVQSDFSYTRAYRFTVVGA